MTPEQAWQWITENQRLVAWSVRRRKLASMFDSMEDAMQEATLRCVTNIARFYDATRGSLSKFVDRTVSQFGIELRRLRDTKKRGAGTLTKQVADLSTIRDVTATPGDDLAARDEATRLLTCRPGGTGRKVPYQTRFDVLYARLVARQPWARIAEEFGYSSKESAKESVSKVIKSLRKRNSHYAAA